jgi:Predicted flavoprotein
MAELQIGIIVGSTREGRVSPQVAQWVKEQAEAFNNNQYEIVDVKDYQLPMLGESADVSGVERWNTKLAELDGFILLLQNIITRFLRP